MYKLIYNICSSFLMAYKTNARKAKRKKRARELKKFRSTFAAVNRKLSLDEMAQITGISVSKLRNYGSGVKNPGTATIRKFHTKLKAEIEKLFTSRQAGKTTRGQAEWPKDITTKLVNSLILNNNRVWTHSEKNYKRFDKMLATYTRLINRLEFSRPRPQLTRKKKK
jgi:transcriptional regulator with XRE-family HTH domain